MVQARDGRRLEVMTSGPDCAADVAAILDHLGADQFVTADRSGGGPHALACAALLPDRCLAAASLAGPAPRRAEGLDCAEAS